MSPLKVSLRKALTDVGFYIVCAMVAGVVVGSLMGTQAAVFAPLGTLFIQLIRMLVVPLVLVSIVSGSASLGATRTAGAMGLKTISYILVTTITAIVLALFLGEWLKPGSGISIDMVRSLLPESGYSAEPQKMKFWPTLIGFIPANPLQAMAEGNILQIIVFGLFFGFGLSTLADTAKQPLLTGINAILKALIWCIEKVIWIAPIGVFGLMADATGTFGFDVLLKIGNLLWVNLLAAFIMLALLYPASLLLFSKMKLTPYFKELLRPQMVAFSTASSLATLPITLKTCEEKLGVSKETASFVVPLGATINMTGNAIYYTLVAVFFAQLYQMDLGIAHYLAIVVTASVGAIGQAGVPGPTLLVVAVLLAAGIPIEGLPLLYALDRVFDMLRTVLNITGDVTCAIVVDDNNPQTKH